MKGVIHIYVLLSTLTLPVLSQTLCSHFGWSRAARSERRRRRHHRRRRRRLYGTRPGFPAIACPILCPSWCPSRCPSRRPGQCPRTGSPFTMCGSWGRRWRRRRPGRSASWPGCGPRPYRRRPAAQATRPPPAPTRSP